MRGPVVHPIVIAAGGTGGHFFPAEALAAELVARGHRIVLMTDARSGGLSGPNGSGGLSSPNGPGGLSSPTGSGGLSSPTGSGGLSGPTFAGREQYVISGAGIAGRGLWRGAKAVGALGAGVAQARRILGRIGAGGVVGFGGYPSVAPVLGARLLRHRPAVILHEQNAVLGRANRFLASRADVLALGFEGTERVPPGVRTEVTGNPVRPAIAALSLTSYIAASDRISLLVLGGSLGARVFSDVVPAALVGLPPALRARLSVVQQVRPEDLDRVRAAYAAAGITAELSPFFPDVAARLAAAHLVIARAGASTVAELAVAGRPAILVPLPGAIDDHQTANARALAAAGGAWLVPQTAFTPALLTERLGQLLPDAVALAQAAAGARGCAQVDAAVRLADLVEARMAARAGEHV
jgi:UDP-N-acetylglucosamine--N-acetylmuramyl-(pentapeptide) pyrophosphoryl-undecaprenol N-acetylglucosamine transferase